MKERGLNRDPVEILEGRIFHGKPFLGIKKPDVIDSTSGQNPGGGECYPLRTHRRSPLKSLLKKLTGLAGS